MYKNLAAAFAAACFIFPVFSQTTPAALAPLKVGFVYVTPVTDAGWVRQHENGRQAVQAALGTQVKTSFVENVPEGPDAERAHALGSVRRQRLGLVQGVRVLAGRRHTLWRRC